MSVEHFSFIMAPPEKKRKLEQQQRPSNYFRLSWRVQGPDCEIATRIVYLNASEDLYPFLSSLTFNGLDDEDGFDDFVSGGQVSCEEPSVLDDLQMYTNIYHDVFDKLLTIDDLPKLKEAKAVTIRLSQSDEASHDWQPFDWSVVFSKEPAKPTKYLCLSWPVYEDGQDMMRHMVYLNISDELLDYFHTLLFAISEGDDETEDFLEVYDVKTYEPVVLDEYSAYTNVDVTVFDKLLTIDDLPKLKAAKAKCVAWSDVDNASIDWNPFDWSVVFPSE